MAAVHTPLDSALETLDTMLTPDERTAIQRASRDSLAQFHFGLGMVIRNQFGLWRGGALRDYFVAMGITHPDDMSSVLIDAYWHHVNGSSYDIDSLIARIPAAPKVVAVPGSLPER